MSLVISTFSDRWWGNARSFMQWQGTKSGNIIWYHGTWLPEDHGCSTAHVLDTWTSCSTELLAQWGDDLRLRKEIKVSCGFSLHGMSFPVYIIVQFQLNKRVFFIRLVQPQTETRFLVRSMLAPLEPIDFLLVLEAVLSWLERQNEAAPSASSFVF